MTPFLPCAYWPTNEGTCFLLQKQLLIPVAECVHPDTLSVLCEVAHRGDPFAALAVCLMPIVPAAGCVHHVAVAPDHEPATKTIWVVSLA